MNPYSQLKELPASHPIIIALQKGDDVAVRQQLAEGISPYAPGLIAGAVGSMKPSIMQAFLDYGLDLSQPFNTHGETPILRCISTRNKSLEILKILISNGASIGYGPSGGSTPLHTAAGGWPDAIPLLLQAGADVNAKATNGRTPLMLAAAANLVGSLELLLGAGANLEDRDQRGSTALISAARAGSTEAAEWLLDHGADIQAKDDRGKTAVYWATENGHQQVAELLQTRLKS